MIFTLEALQAKHGDALLLHYGSAAAPGLVVIDGGPAGIYRKVVRKHLDALKATRSPEGPLPVRLLMVSHIDDDHVHGVLDLTHDLIDRRESHKPLPYEIATLWHNSFDDVLGEGSRELAAALAAGPSDASREPPLSRGGALVVASVGQGRDLRSVAAALGLAVNSPFAGLVTAPGRGSQRLDLGLGLSFTVLGPTEERVEALRAEWAEMLERIRRTRGADARALGAGFLDTSVFNLSSIVVLAEAGPRTMLLTGDARGDDVLAAMHAAGLLRRGTAHVDLLKLPHHGSARNIDKTFFRQITADHYVISADGRFGNPDVETLQLLTDARGRAEYTIHLTNPVPDAVNFLEKDRANNRRRYTAAVRGSGADAVRVDLGDALVA